MSQETKDLKLEEAYKSVFSTKEGQMVIRDLMVECNVMVPHAESKHSLEHLEGRRYVCLHIIERSFADDTLNFLRDQTRAANADAFDPTEPH